MVIDVNRCFPYTIAATVDQAKALADAGAIWDELASDEDEDAPSIFVSSTKGIKSKAQTMSFDGNPSTSSMNGFLNFSRCTILFSSIC